MPRFVEDVGPPLSAGWLSRSFGAAGEESGEVRVGDRSLGWELNGDGTVTVSHLAAEQGGVTLSYAVGLTFTSLPSRGVRWWFRCPACGRRVDYLYLLPERDRLACRRCCQLYFAKQYNKKRRRRKRPSIVVPIWMQVGRSAATTPPWARRKIQP